jgi:nitrilase
MSKEANVAKAVSMIADAKCRGAQLVVLPECFNCPYGTKYFPEYAEDLVATSQTYEAMSTAARANEVWLIAGSIPERENGKLYNTSMTFNPQGALVGKHRKIHLFQINTETVKFDESEVLTAGSEPTVVSLLPDHDLTVGVGICFDIRFPQLSMRYTELGTSLLIYPGAFNKVTGPAHWELLARARAVDHQQFVVLCSPARDELADYVAWGHSLISDPWGTVTHQASEGEELLIADLDLSLIPATRVRVPYLKGVRHDLYNLSWK